MKHRLGEIVQKELSAWGCPDSLIAEALEDLNSSGEFSVWPTVSSLTTEPMQSDLQNFNRLRLDQGRKVHLAFASGGIPMNNASFPRGLIYAGIKFPFWPEGERNQLVTLLPARPLKYPRYRHLALPKGVNRQEASMTIRDVILRVNQAELLWRSHQISLLTFLWHQKVSTNLLPILLIDLERVCSQTFQKYGPEFFDEAEILLWNVRPDHTRGEKIAFTCGQSAEAAELLGSERAIFQHQQAIRILNSLCQKP